MRYRAVHRTAIEDHAVNGTLKQAAIEVDRKVLADLAVFDKPAFAELANRAKTALGIA